MSSRELRPEVGNRALRVGIPPLNAFEREARMRFFGDCTGVVDFAPGTKVVTVRVTFDAETTYPEEQQRQGWQAISIIWQSTW
jgi:hypothetical protein